MRMSAPVSPPLPNWASELTVGEVMSVIAAVLAVIVAIQQIRRITKPYLDGWKNFLDDWNGEPSRPGVTRRKGVMERLDALEHTTNATNHEVNPNGGSSLADKVNKISDILHSEDKTSRHSKSIGEQGTLL